MEIYYWLLFFMIMIFISFFSWVELFGIFICTVMLLGGVFNYENYRHSNNILVTFMTTFLVITNMIGIMISNGWEKFTQTFVGNLIFKFLVYLENNYQLIKNRIKKEIMKQALTNFQLSNKNSNLLLRGTPRISDDDEDTDED